jgi:hypothetical protein
MRFALLRAPAAAQIYHRPYLKTGNVPQFIDVFNTKAGFGFRLTDFGLLAALAP